MSKKCGFTVAEVMAASTLIIVLSFGVFGMFAQTRNSAKDKQCLNNLSNLAKACEFYSARHNSAYPDTLDDLTAGSYVNDIPSCPFRNGSVGRYGYTTARNPAGYTAVYTVYCTLLHPGDTVYRQAGSKITPQL